MTVSTETRAYLQELEAYYAAADRDGTAAPTNESEEMTTQSEHPTDYEQTLDDAQECLGDIAELAWKFPISSMIDYARQNGLPEAIIARLEDIVEAAAKLVHHAPDAIWDFAKAAG